jgi:hypothetical protein
VKTCTFMIISRSLLLKIRNRENQNTQFMFNNVFSKNLGVYEIMWKNVVDDNLIRRMRIAWKLIRLHAQLECIELIAFACQQWLQEPA